MLDGGDAPTELAGEVQGILDEWVADDAPLLDADDDGDKDYDEDMLELLSIDVADEIADAQRRAADTPRERRIDVREIEIDLHCFHSCIRRFE